MSEDPFRKRGRRRDSEPAVAGSIGFTRLSHRMERVTTLLGPRYGKVRPQIPIEISIDRGKSWTLALLIGGKMAYKDIPLGQMQFNDGTFGYLALPETGQDQLHAAVKITRVELGVKVVARLPGKVNLVDRHFLYEERFRTPVTTPHRRTA